MRHRLGSIIVSAALCVLAATAIAAEKNAATRVVQDGMLVSLQYTLSGEDGKVIESNKGKEPLKYVHGTQAMISGLEREITGMKIGAEKHVTIKPQDAYGLIDFNKLKEVPRNQIPPNGMKVGAQIARKDEQGRIHLFKVHEIRQNTVVLDLNHPMAGKTLVFDVKIVDIQPATPEKPAPPLKPEPPQSKKAAQPK